MPLKSITFLLALCLCLLGATAQQKKFNYNAAWKKIDSTIDKAGLLRSAMDQVMVIYRQAKTEKNHAQLIKSLIYRATLNEQLSEAGSTENIAMLEKETAGSAGAARSILQSITASAYLRYLQQNRWKFYDRTNTPDLKKEDISTWTIDDLNSRISALFLSSLHDKDRLQKTKLSDFDPVIIRGNARQLRPTLYDLLAHRALLYFMNDERYVTKPAYAFEITGEETFAPPGPFATHAFPSKDTLSLHYRALEIFRDLTRFHLNDTDPSALVDLTLQRLQFARNFSVHEDKETLYGNALEQLIAAYPGKPATADAMFLLAQWHVDRGREYDPLRDTSNRYAINRAIDICRAAMAIRDSAEGKTKCANLLIDITRPEITLRTEKVNVPGLPFRALVNYRNVATAYFRVIKIDRALREKIGNDSWRDNFWTDIATLPAAVSFAADLPATGDHQLHRVEIRVDALPSGEYALLASTNSSFSTINNALSLQYLYVSDIAHVSRNSGFYILNRSTGAPLPGARVQLWRERYDYKDQKRVLEKASAHIADINGYFSISQNASISGKNSPNNQSYFLEITHQNERLFINEPIYTYDYREWQKPEKEALRTFLFTDRSIYRPGQTVYFKGIMVNEKSNPNSAAIVPKRPGMAVLFDANGEPVDSISIQTSEFGSYSGRFTLPEGRLNGAFSIMDTGSRNRIYFNVEEYKRPRFNVEIQKPAGTYRANDTVSVQGIARAFAGNNITGATVTYRVTRRSLIPMWSRISYMPRIWPPYPRQEMEIANGTVTTDEEGNFSIAFKAIPDKSIQKAHAPVFYYEVNVDVTDISGETHSGSGTVSVGYQALKMQLGVPSLFDKDSLEKIELLTTNMNDVFERTTAHVVIHKLRAPSRMFRERYWEQPDQFVMGRGEYYRHFPHDMYSNEDDMSRWAREKKWFEISMVTSPDSSIFIDTKKFDAGWYVAEALAKDRFGDTVKAVSYFRIDDRQISSPFTTARIAVSKPVAQPGDRVQYRLLTNADSITIMHELVNHKGEQREWIKPAPFSRTYEIAVEEADRGNMVVNMFFVQHNRVYTLQSNISIPFRNKELKIDYTSFRDKTTPGSPEQWKIKISGQDGEKLSAEILTAMYDASLNEFKPHRWYMPHLWRSYTSTQAWGGTNNFEVAESQNRSFGLPQREVKPRIYDRLYSMYEEEVYANGAVRGIATLAKSARNDALQAEKVTAPTVAGDREPASDESANYQGEETTEPAPPPAPPSIQVRKNLAETAFFFPELQTDAEGNVEFSFTTPESLTQWKWMILAHTRELAFGYGEKTMITQKQLMVQPNMPRFLREGDIIDISARIANMTADELSGTATLQLIDPATGEAADAPFQNIAPGQFFTAAPGQSIDVRFSITVPFNFKKPVQWRIIAQAAVSDSASGKAGTLNDGEQDVLPVITNRMLVTETLTLPMKGAGAKNFRFEKLLASSGSGSLQHHALTVEFTSNPAWFAVQALPYLTEGRHENAEQVFNRYFANALASRIAGSAPRLKAIIEKWKISDTTAFLSNLQKNEELKSVLLQETPWVLEAKTESEQKRNIALLFDMTRMQSDLDAALARLATMQAPTGGFVWYTGGPEHRYMTQYILTGIGHLRNLGALPASDKMNQLIRKGVAYLDRELRKEYDLLKKANKALPESYTGYLPVQYLYMRSYFTDIGVPGDVFEAYNYFRNQSKKQWLKYNTYMRGMIALSLQRTGEKLTATKIMAALKETAIRHEELGMYWKDMSGGYYWHQAPIESQALLIEAFDEILRDENSVNEMKTWLLKQKQTNSWKTSRATAEACYALLLRGSDWLSTQPEVVIKAGSLTITPGEDAQAGTGYFKKSIAGNEVAPAMGNITVTVSGSGNETVKQPSWGGIYWQYFEDLDKITSAATPLQLKKQVFAEENTDRGPVLKALSDNHSLKLGDKAIVRIEIRVDRDMEYVHMKDMRGSCMEPVNVLSSYRWKGGLGYYETTRDASTDFFFDRLPKGTYVFEYTMFATQTGTFNNGITTIQCMYAPEFSSHSEGIKITVVK